MSDPAAPRVLARGRLLHWTSRLLGAAGLVLVGLFLVAPILVATSVSFTADTILAFPPVGFSLRWYADILHSPTWRAAIVNTLAIGAMCAATATAIGTLSAYGISRLRDPALRDGLLILFLAPLAVPYMSLGIAIYPTFAALGLVGTRLGVALAQAVIAMPFVVLSVTAIIRRRDRDLESASRTLGATPFKGFCYIVLPLLAPGIAAGAVLAFMTSFDDVVMPIFLGGLHAGTVPKMMLDSLALTSDPSVMAASTAIAGVGLLLFLGVGAIRRPRHR